MKTTRIAALLLAGLLTQSLAPALTLDVRDCGAIGDGSHLDTQAIQTAIDRCATAGGGTVLLQTGRFLSGTIHLKSRVTLLIQSGATLLGSTNLADYPRTIPALRSYTDNYVNQSLIAGENLDHIGLAGQGLIDGQGAAFPRDPAHPYENRPYLIRLVNCRDVQVEGLRLQNAAMWMQHYLACERVRLRGLQVRNFGNANNDALDLDGCNDCLVSQCVFESDDDAITLKSTLDRPAESITISDCIARSHCNAIKLGTESNGGFKNITIANCVITSPAETNIIYGRPRGTSGISLELVDGGRLERIAINNLTIHGVTVPLFLRLGNRARPFQKDLPAPPIGTFQDVLINNVVATDVGTIGCSITGLPGHPIENVLLSNLAFTFEGGGTREHAAVQVPELPKQYPESIMFGRLPAYGFFARHVTGLRFSNLSLRTSTPDLRHAFLCDDVQNLALAGLDAQFSRGAAPLLKLLNVRRALITACQPRAADGTFVQLAGDSTRNIALTANDLSAVGRPLDLAPEVPENSVTLK